MYSHWFYDEWNYGSNDDDNTKDTDMNLKFNEPNPDGLAKLRARSPRVPRCFQSNWTMQMSNWLLDTTAQEELDLAPADVREFIEERWVDICNSWGCRDKWSRVVGCLEGPFKWMMVNELGELGWERWINHLNKRSECWAKGHNWTTVEMDGTTISECDRCGRPLS